MIRFLYMIVLLSWVVFPQAGCTSPPNGGGVAPVPFPLPQPAPGPAPAPILIDDAVVAAKIEGLRQIAAQDRQWAVNRAALLDELANVIDRNRAEIKSTKDIQTINDRIGSIRFSGEQPLHFDWAQQIEDITVAQLGGLDFRTLEAGEIDKLIRVYRAMAAALRG